MSQKIKAPNSKGGSGFLWIVVAILAIAAVVVFLVVRNNTGGDQLAAEMPQEDVNFTVAREGSSVVLASQDLKEDAPVVEIFEDFSCPHCAGLAEADHEDSLQALNEGKVKIKFNFLNFLDGEATGSSTRGAAVALAVAETGNAKAFWNAHSEFLTNQTEVARKWDYEEFGQALQAYDLDQSVIDSISKGEVQDAVLPVVKANADDLTEREGSVSSPLVYADGKRVELKKGSDNKVQSWVPDVVK